MTSHWLALGGGVLFAAGLVAIGSSTKIGWNSEPGLTDHRLVTDHGRSPANEERLAVSTQTVETTTRDEDRLRHAQIFADVLLEHATRDVDMAWRAAFQPAVQDELRRLGEKYGFEASRVDCRGRSCIALLTWPDHATALGGWENILARAGLPCARHTLLPDLDDPEATKEPYSHWFVYKRCADTISPT